MTATKLKPRREREERLTTPTDLSSKAVEAIAGQLNPLVADAYSLYVKTKNFHWHMSGPNFRDYHLLLDEQAEQIYASIDPLAERVRKLGAPTLKSIAELCRLARVKDNAEDYLAPCAPTVELMNDNKAVAAAMREAHECCEDNKDVGTASLLEVFIDEAERRTWFLFESARGADPSGH